MNTPIYDFLQSYADSDVVRLHMPGHKGKAYCDPLAVVHPYDITEIKGADSLFEAKGIIRESEENAACLFGAKRTLYSVQGSTLCIQTMLALAARPGNTVIAARNAHKAFLNTCVLLDLKVSWIYPEAGILMDAISSIYTLKDIEKAILEASEPSCVYITSPDYYGRMADIEAISGLCKKYKLPLLVDNAHGAHLAFLEENRHPMALGADMCCDSAHKMLPALTGGAYLHSKNERFIGQAKDTMALFASTSPSYLILCSLDLCNRYLDQTIREHLEDAVKGVLALKARLSAKFEIIESEPLRIPLYAPSVGLSGIELSEVLRDHKIECEYADASYTVLLFSPLSSCEDFEAVFQGLAHFEKRTVPAQTATLCIEKPERVLSIRQASLADNEELPVEQSLNRICGKAKVVCPPGIPIVAAGEKISENCINILKKYSILTVNVVK